MSQRSPSFRLPPVGGTPWKTRTLFTPQRNGRIKLPIPTRPYFKDLLIDGGSRKSSSISPNSAANFHGLSVAKSKDDPKSSWESNRSNVGGCKEPFADASQYD